ncbi:unnamed protein product, partial [Lymnaea stagnalis]
NLINISVYLKIGLKDSINICFFVLSCADLTCVVMLGVQDVIAIFPESIQLVWRTDGLSLNFLVAFYYGAFYDVSQGITTFIAVQKCWCVALPFRFKGTFTTARTAVIVAAVSVAALSMNLPVLSTQGLQEIMLPGANATLLLLWTAESRQQIIPIVGLVSLIYTNTCQFTVIFCLVVLASNLRASSKFRNSSTVSTVDPPATSDLKIDNSKQNLMTDRLSCKKGTAGHRTITGNRAGEISTSGRKDIAPAPRRNKITSRKELQAIKSTTFVSILFVSCNTFKLLNYYVILCVPEYKLNGRFQNTYFLSNSCRIFLESLHISLNMFVYLKFNTRFRSTLMSGCGTG